MVVDEIWNTYDVDNSGELDKKEILTFVQEVMPEFTEDFKISEEVFEKIFKSIDLDGNGTIE